MVNKQPNTLTPSQSAKYMGVSEAVLRLWRSRAKDRVISAPVKNWCGIAALISTVGFKSA